MDKSRDKPKDSLDYSFPFIERLLYLVVWGLDIHATPKAVHWMKCAEWAVFVTSDATRKFGHKSHYQESDSIFICWRSTAVTPSYTHWTWECVYVKQDSLIWSTSDLNSRRNHLALVANLKTNWTQSINMLHHIRVDLFYCNTELMLLKLYGSILLSKLV